MVNRGKIYGYVAMAFFMFWICGITSILLDVDHIWSLFKAAEPINIGIEYGRPFHNIILYFIFSFIAGIILTPLVSRYCARIELNLTLRSTLIWLMINICTFIFLFWFCQNYAYRWIVKLIR